MKNEPCFQAFLGAMAIQGLSSLQKPVLKDYGSSFQPECASGVAG